MNKEEAVSVLKVSADISTRFDKRWSLHVLKTENAKRKVNDFIFELKAIKVKIVILIGAN